VDSAVGSFWTAAELLLTLERPDDALKVIERILHFRAAPRFARAAAELYLKKNDQQGGMQALAKLQVAFQSDPKDLDTLALLAQAFEVIGQPDKSLAVHIEMARLAREQNKRELWAQIVQHLSGVAPNNPEVVALVKQGGPQDGLGASAGVVAAPAAAVAPRPQAPAPRVDVVELEVEPEPEEIEAQSLPSVSIPADDLRSFDPPALRRTSQPPSVQLPSVGREQPVDLDAELEYVDETEAPASAVPVHDDSVAVNELRRFDVVESRAPGMPESFHASSHAHKAIVDAESFRRLGLLDKAVEALHIALEIDPNSVPIREKLREILVDAGERDAAIQETINIAIIHLHNQEPDLAEPLVLEVLEIEPNHPDAQTLLYHVGSQRESQARPTSDGHLDSFDLEGVRPSSAMSDIPADAPLPSFPLDEDDAGRLDRASRRPSPEAIEGVLEEAEFFAAQGLYFDAEAILEDTLRLAPDHVLLKERLAEIRADRTASNVQGPPSSLGPTDNSFDIAATLDALDDLDGPKRPKLDTVNQEVDVDQVFAKFKEGVKATVDESDTSTHFDLGVAYREMGLLADAIGEFEIAGRDPARYCTCYALIGLIAKQMGDLSRARSALERALATDKKSAEQEKGILYDLALVAEEQGDAATYQSRLRQLAGIDSAYKDVAKRLASLGSATTPPASDDDLEAAFDHLLG
jgi:tetratricopeptide (TPR) repeat protein